MSKDQLATPGRLIEYRENAEAWGSAVADDAQKANTLFDRLHSIAKELRTTTEGRDGLEGLTRHEMPGVRLLAATECLAWAPDRAIPVLESIQSGVGLHAVSAKYTLASYRSGTLDLDW